MHPSTAKPMNINATIKSVKHDQVIKWKHAINNQCIMTKCKAYIYYFARDSIKGAKQGSK